MRDQVWLLQVYTLTGYVLPLMVSIAFSSPGRRVSDMYELLLATTWEFSRPVLSEYNVLPVSGACGNPFAAKPRSQSV